MTITWPPETLGESLAGLTVDALKPLASLCTSPLPTRKDDLIAVIAGSLRDRSFVTAQVQQLDRAAQLALAEAAYGDGTVDPARLKAKHGISFTPPGSEWGYFGLGYGYGYGQKRDPDKMRPGLLFYHGRVPRDLLPVLREILPPPPDFVLPARDELPDTVPARGGREQLTIYHTEAAAQHDLIATLALVRQDKLTVSEATHQPTGAAVRLLRERYLISEVVTIEDSTRADDAVRPFAFTMIVQAAGLARATGTRLALTKTGQAALDAPTPALLKRCWDAWQGWKGLDELARVRGIKGQKAKGQRFTPLAGRRAAIAAALAECPAGQWIAMSDFLRLIRVAHDFEVESSVEVRLPVGYSAEHAWSAIVGSYIRAAMLEYATALGLVDVAVIPPEAATLDFKLYTGDEGLFSRYAGLSYLRLTALGRYILGQTPSYEAPPPPEMDGPILKVLPTLEVVVVSRTALTPADRRLLERFTIRRSDDVYGLTRERLLEAAEEGFALETGRDLLERLGGAALPQTVTVLFSDIERRSGSVWEVGPAVLLRCSDSFLAQVITHDKTLRRLCLPAGDDHVVVPTGSLPAFRRGLKQLGYVIGAGEAAAISRS